jgi:hypothetical protein
MHRYGFTTLISVVKDLHNATRCPEDTGPGEHRPERDQTMPAIRSPAYGLLVSSAPQQESDEDIGGFDSGYCWGRCRSAFAPSLEITMIKIQTCPEEDKSKDGTEYVLSTEQFATLNLVKPQTVRARLCMTGTYHGIAPQRLRSGRLAWPNEQVLCGWPARIGGRNLFSILSQLIIHVCNWVAVLETDPAKRGLSHRTNRLLILLPEK